MITFEFDGEESSRLDVFLAKCLPDRTRSQIKKFIDDGAVTVNGKPAKAGLRLEAGDRVAVAELQQKPASFGPVAMPLSIIFEDDHLLVVNKPAGIAVHPGAGEQQATLVQGVLAHTQLSSGVSDPAFAGGDDEAGELTEASVRPGVVHRLDKGTTGALVFAKSDRVHFGLAKQFAEKSNFRQYIALLNGAMKSPEIVYESWLRRDPHHRQKFCSVDAAIVAKLLAEGQEPPHARWSKSVFRREAVYGNRFSLASIRLYTGRTHQIRIHARDLNLPVVGDPVYGVADYQCMTIPKPLVDRMSSIGRQMLHAWILGFRHPVTGDDLRFEAPIPADFLEILHGLEKYKTG